MAGSKYIKIPTDFFDREPIATIGRLQDGDGAILLYLKMMFDAYDHNRKGILDIAGIQLTDHILHVIYRHDNIGTLLSILEEHRLIKRDETSIQTFKFWEEERDRNTQEYKEWRSAVYKRDGYKCVECGNKKQLQAHHIKPWKWYEEGRYQVDNGITLCRKCHLKAHGGCWHSGRC